MSVAATLNNISVTSGWSVLLKGTRVPRRTTGLPRITLKLYLVHLATDKQNFNKNPKTYSP
jgi:hypothetical protein